MDIATKQRNSVSKLFHKLKRVRICRVKVGTHRSRLKLKLYTHDGSTRDVITSLPLDPPEYSVVISDEKSQSEFEDNELFDDYDDKGIALDHVLPTTGVTAEVVTVPVLVNSQQPVRRRNRSSSPSPSYTAATSEYVPIFTNENVKQPTVNKINYRVNPSNGSNGVRRAHSSSPVRDNGRPLILFKSQVPPSTGRHSISPEPRQTPTKTKESIQGVKGIAVSSRTVHKVAKNEIMVTRFDGLLHTVQYGIVIYLLFVLLG